MSEDLTRDPLLGKLARLAPTTAGIDRDAMLFACGRASAPKAGRWKVAAAALVLSQVAVLGVWLGGVQPFRASNRPLIAHNEAPAATSPVRESEPLAADAYGRLVQSWEPDELPPPPAMADPPPSVPVLSICSSRYFVNVD